MRVAITGGGTGGHLSIARALAIECKKRGFEVIYIGSTSGQDKLWFEESDIFIKSYFLSTTGVVNKRGFGIVKALCLQFRAALESRRILKQHNVSFVISVGGFSAGGGAMGAIIARIPLFIHEQNSVLGSLNKFLAPFAKAVFCSFDINLKNLIKIPYPINEDFFVNARNRDKLKNILFLGGSQGAVAINNFALKIAPKLEQRGIRIIHQCGEKDFSRVESEYKRLNIKADVFAFDKRILEKIKEADFCVSRAGASSLWELCANRLPAYFIPYPYAAKNHQYFNALFLKQKGLGEVIEQQNLNENDFLAYIDSINLLDCSIGLQNLAKNNGAKAIVDTILKNIK